MENNVCISSPELTTPTADPTCPRRTDVHRLGRTARAGKEGSGLLILDPIEVPFVASKGMKELPLGETTENELLGQPGATGWGSKIESATESVDLDVRAGSYRVGRIYSTHC